MATRAKDDKKTPTPGTYRTDAVTDIALTMPIFVAYHIGVAFLPVRNAADIVTSRLAALADHSRLAYMGLTAALGGLVVLALFGFGHRDKLKLTTFGLVIVEGIVYAFTMRYLAGLASNALPLAGGDAPDRLTGIVMSLGAGFYEELAFRVLAFGLGAKFLVHLDDWPKWIVMPLWALACATAFSLWHHIGPSGEPFDAHAFVFRTVCGLVFTVIYVFRGFSPAVWTHALYDLWVLAL